MNATPVSTENSPAPSGDILRWIFDEQQAFNALQPLFDNRRRMTAALRTEGSFDRPRSAGEQFLLRIARLEQDRSRSVAIYCDLSQTPSAWITGQAPVRLASMFAARKLPAPVWKRAIRRAAAWLNDPLIDWTAPRTARERGRA